MANTLQPGLFADSVRCARSEPRPIQCFDEGLKSDPKALKSELEALEMDQKALKSELEAFSEENQTSLA